MKMNKEKIDEYNTHLYVFMTFEAKLCSEIVILILKTGQYSKI